MILEDQVCNLELAKRLKELGVKQDAYWSWVTNRANPYRREKDHTYLLESLNSYNFKDDDKSSAFSVAELGEMLKEFHLPLWNQKGWKVPGTRSRNGSSENTEADARAKILIYLLENKLIEVEK